MYVYIYIYIYIIGAHDAAAGARPFEDRAPSTPAPDSRASITICNPHL